MSEIVKKLSSMLNNNSNESSQNTESIPNNLDLNTIMKMQEIIKAMNSESHNSGSNLLRSLKPYLNPNRQDKVDQYIQLLNIEKVLKLLNNNEEKL